jgi:hypothetical protein
VCDTVPGERTLLPVSGLIAPSLLDTFVYLEGPVQVPSIV